MQESSADVHGHVFTQKQKQLVMTQYSASPIYESVEKADELNARLSELQHVLLSEKALTQNSVLQVHIGLLQTAISVLSNHFSGWSGAVRSFNHWRQHSNGISLLNTTVSLKRKREPETTSKKPAKKRGRTTIDTSGFYCHQCFVRVSPEWRKGPDGPRTLCNACGLRYAKGLKKKKLEAMKQTQEKMNIKMLLN